MANRKQMMSRKILHVCNLDKFIPPFINFLEDHFSFKDHFLWLNGDHEKFPIRSCLASYEVELGAAGKFKGMLKLIQLMQVSEKIILHGLFNREIVLILFFMPSLLKKCYWVMWGGDLYAYRLREKNWKRKSQEYFRRHVIKNVGYLVCYVEGDYELAKEWYGVRGQWIKCFFYPSNLYQNVNLHQRQDNDVNILVGNSADPRNKHSEIFDKLEKFKDQSLKIYAPLSYGDPAYANAIVKEGKMRFGEKFLPITEFIEFNQYLEFLGCIDIAIFNHDRQQGMGTIRTLLGLGKKVFMPMGITSVEALKCDGIKVFSISEINLDPNFDEKTNNEILVREIYSEKNLISCLSKIWNS